MMAQQRGSQLRPHMIRGRIMHKEQLLLFNRYHPSIDDDECSSANFYFDDRHLLYSKLFAKNPKMRNIIIEKVSYIQNFLLTCSFYCR